MLRLTGLLSLCAGACSTLWPQPAAVSVGSLALPLAADFAFFSEQPPGVILAAAFRRYAAIVSLRALPAAPFAGGVAAGTAVSALDVTLRSPSEVLAANTSEAYDLRVAAPRATLVADNVFAALRGMETFSQLVEYTPSAPGLVWPFIVVAANVTDAPRFAYRGALVDTARHFVPLPQLLSFIDALAYNKVNVFHWHITDDQSFPFESEEFPVLSALGAFGGLASHTYRPADVGAILVYALQRGIRVIVEFDTPGHSASWGAGVPGLLTPCYNNATPPAPDGTYGPIDPTNEATYTFLAAFFAEVARRFPAEIHIGGDEVAFGCWASSPPIAAWMAAHGMAAGDFAALEGYYVQRVLGILSALGRRAIGYEELFDNGLALPPGTIISVWKYHNSYPPTNATRWMQEMANVTAAGFPVILASPWYLNVISYGVDWQGFYAVEPLDWPGSPAQKALVLGGELSMWGEYVDGANLLSRTWPRGAAVAERLWSPVGVTDLVDAAVRINDQRCRMLARGLPAGALVPGYCPTEVTVPYVPPWAAV